MRTLFVLFFGLLLASIIGMFVYTKFYLPHPVDSATQALSTAQLARRPKSVMHPATNLRALIVQNS